MMSTSMNKDVHRKIIKPAFDRVPKCNMQIRFWNKTHSSNAKIGITTEVNGRLGHIVEVRC